MSASEAQESMLASLFSAIDAKDGDAFVDHLTEDASFRFGSAPAAVGRDAIHAAVTGFFETIAGLSHEIDLTTTEGDTLIFEGTVSYARHDGSSIALPFVDVFEMDDLRIKDYKIYMDIAPLYSDA